MIRRVPEAGEAAAATEVATAAVVVTAATEAGATYSFPARVVRVAGEQAGAAEATAAVREAETMSQAKDLELR